MTSTTTIEKKPNTVASSHSSWTTPLYTHIETLLCRYFSELEGYEPTNLHTMVMEAVETPLLKAVMQYHAGNQTKAATTLGISRVTLRKKLKQYKLL